MKINLVRVTVRHSENQEFIGVDVGDERIGLARGSTLARLAEPLKTVPAQNALTEIADLIQKYQSVGVVVGLPRSLDGQETGQTKKVRSWVAQAKKQIGQPFYWQDEALTSVTASKKAASAAGLDAAAASGILQDFLDTPSGQRVRC